MVSFSVCRAQILSVSLNKHILSSACFATASATRNDSKEQKKEKEEWRTVVGLEIHAQIAAKSKLFSSAGTSFAAPPNSLVSPFDAGHPGTLPVLNKRCVEAGVRTAVALNCQVNDVSTFDRKHYFYADLPTGYQITQQRRPLAQSGFLEFPIITGNEVRFARTSIKQIQLEQDSGKSLHDADRSLVDLNRAGVGLMEIVCEPDLSSPIEAVSFVKELIRVLKAIKTCDCKMEQGSLRVDVNVSVHRPEDPDLGVRTEIKNLSSLNSVSRAIEFEAERQIKTLTSGGKVVNETRGFNDELKATVPMRDKEEKQDYRFMPEPNLPPLNLQAIGIDAEQVKKSLPELPGDVRARLIEDFKLKPVVAASMVNQEYLVDFFMEVMCKNPDLNPSTVANFMLIHLMGAAAEQNADDFRELPNVVDTKIADLLHLVGENTITFDSAGKIMKKLAAGDERHPQDIADNEGYALISDKKEVEKLCQEILEKNPDKVKKAKAGKERAMKGLISELRKTHGDRLHMATAVKILTEMVEKS